ncbi:hypothetical protein TNCT_487611 [Trichonephila clavata]|uniref:Uncharacterized protein n=1 Tax=Trichonephila clavata TaxID=2740835 RepID=A0A8X6LXA3_TRICU|nr:hypothetical protein TNCT_487611 [Trichonephila clavata]
MDNNAVIPSLQQIQSPSTGDRAARDRHPQPWHGETNERGNECASSTTDSPPCASTCRRETPGRSMPDTPKKHLEHLKLKTILESIKTDKGSKIVISDTENSNPFTIFDVPSFFPLAQQNGNPALCHRVHKAAAISPGSSPGIPRSDIQSASRQWTVDSDGQLGRSHEQLVTRIGRILPADKSQSGSRPHRLFLIFLDVAQRKKKKMLRGPCLGVPRCTWTSTAPSLSYLSIPQGQWERSSCSDRRKRRIPLPMVVMNALIFIT